MSKNLPKNILGIEITYLLLALLVLFHVSNNLYILSMDNTPFLWDGGDYFYCFMKIPTVIIRVTKVKPDGCYQINILNLTGFFKCSLCIHQPCLFRRFRPPIPGEAGRLFRLKSATDSGAKRPGIGAKRRWFLINLKLFVLSQISFLFPHRFSF